MASTPASSSRRPKRGELSATLRDERTRIAKTPGIAADCILRLHIVENTQLHKDLIQAIRQFTGYTKSKPNARGLIPSRDIGADGNPLDVLSDAFVLMVETFLVERKGGITFFPQLVGHNTGWHDSWFEESLDMPRLIWGNLEDEQDIRVNLQLLFEALRNNGLPIIAPEGKVLDLQEANHVQTFDTKDCFVCGSPDADRPDDALIYCTECHGNFHQQCYNISSVPVGRWYCCRCTQVKAENAEKAEDKASEKPRAQKRRKTNQDSGGARYRTPTPSKTKKAGGPSEAPMLSSSQYTPSTYEPPVVTSGQYASMMAAVGGPSESPTPSGTQYTPSKMAAVGKPSKAHTPSSTQYTPSKMTKAGGPSKAPTPSSTQYTPSNMTLQASMLTSTQHALSMVAAVGGPSETPTPSGTQYTSMMAAGPAQPQIINGNLVIIARLKDNDSFREVKVENINSTEDLFVACGEVWQVQAAKLFAYLPGSGVLEVLGRSGFKDILKLFPPAPGGEGATWIRFLVLVQGEIYEGGH